MAFEPSMPSAKMVTEPGKLDALQVLVLAAGKMPKGRFLPFGSVSEEFGSGKPWILEFFVILCVRDFLVFAKMCRKDARGSISSLRVCIKGVWLQEVCFGSVLNHFVFSTNCDL